MSTTSFTPGSRTLRASGRALAVAVSILAVCGAATAQTPVTATVSVAPATGKPPAGTCTTTNNHYICVNPDPVKTAGAPGTDVKIVWKLASAGWTFVKNTGIDIKNRKTWKLNEDSSTQYTATNKREDGSQIYKYEINVTNGTTTLPPWDPTIMN